MTKITKEELENNLAGFTGTESYTRMKYPWANLLLTDGVAYLCKNAECYWLLDVIASYQPKQLRDCEFQHWTLTVATEDVPAMREFTQGSMTDGIGKISSQKIPPVKNGSSVVTCSDGNEHTLVEQRIDWANFPLNEIRLYAERTEYPERGLVVMLTSEY